MGSFLDVVLPPFLLMVLVAGVIFVAGWWVAGRLRLMSAERRRIDNPRKALASARDALASVISDPALFGTTRDQALAAYDVVRDALNNKEIDN